MLDLLMQTLDGTIYTMTTVFLMLFITGLMTEMGVFQRISYLARPLVSISHARSIGLHICGQPGVGTGCEYHDRQAQG